MSTWICDDLSQPEVFDTHLCSTSQTASEVHLEPDRLHELERMYKAIRSLLEWRFLSPETRRLAELLQKQLEKQILDEIKVVSKAAAAADDAA